MSHQKILAFLESDVYQSQRSEKCHSSTFQISKKSWWIWACQKIREFWKDSPTKIRPQSTSLHNMEITKLFRLQSNLREVSFTENYLSFEGGCSENGSFTFVQLSIEVPCSSKLRNYGGFFRNYSANQIDKFKSKRGMKLQCLNFWLAFNWNNCRSFKIPEKSSLPSNTVKCVKQAWQQEARICRLFWRKTCVKSRLKSRQNSSNSGSHLLVASSFGVLFEPSLFRFCGITCYLVIAINRDTGCLKIFVQSKDATHFVVVLLVTL